MPTDIEILDAPLEASADLGGGAADAAAASVAGEPVAAADAGAAEELLSDDAPEAPAAIEVEYPESAPEAAEPLTVAAATLQGLLAAHAPLAQAVEGDPQLKSFLDLAVERSVALEAYQQVAPTLEQAREAVATSAEMTQYRAALDGERPEEFLNLLYQGQLTVDPETQKPVSSGAYERVMQYAHQLLLDRLEARATQQRDDKLLESVQTIRAGLGWARPVTPGKVDAGEVSAAAAALPPAVRQELERARRTQHELETLRQERSAEQAERSAQYYDEVAGQVAGELRGFVGGLLGPTGFSDYVKEKIAQDFIRDVAVRADRDRAHRAAMEEIARGGLTPETRQRLVTRAQSWARQNGREILEPILRKAGAALKQQQQEREARQSQAQRPEPSAGGAPARPSRLSERERIAASEKKLGRRMTDREILDL
ncbi:MAG: hypothetical protein ACYC6M_03685 [Terriglobales bacterium]